MRTLFDDQPKAIAEPDAALNPPLKRHGGKHYLAPWIISLMPPRARNSNKPADDDPGWVTYVESYFGGGAVLLALDPEGISEVVNDIDGDLTNFWDVLKSPVDYAALQRLLALTPCSQVEFERAATPDHDPVSRAAAFFIRNRQSRQGLGKGFATLARNRTRGGMNELASAWLSAIEGLPEVHARLQRVIILRDEAVNVIKQQDGPRTIFYCDPPYVHSCRETTAAYAHEMSDADHRRLLETLSGIKGRFLLSGYPSDLYAEFASRHGWRLETREIDNKASSAKEKRKETECLWMNF